MTKLKHSLRRRPRKMERRELSKFRRSHKRVCFRLALQWHGILILAILTDIDLNFKATVMRAVAPFDDTEEIELPNMDDLNKTFRTRFITIWLLMNSVLGKSVME